MKGGDFLSEKDKLANCIRQCEKLITQLEEASDIPPERFRGRTAEALKTIRQKELFKIKTICKKVHALLEEH